MLRLSVWIKPVLMNYMISMKALMDFRGIQQASASYKVMIYGELVDVYRNETKYFCLDKGRFFYGGIIDNNDLVQTINNDLEKYGLFVLALKHLDDSDYVANLIELYGDRLIEELSYVFGRCINQSGLPVFEEFVKCSEESVRRGVQEAHGH